jgi:hypothetical protein
VGKGFPELSRKIDVLKKLVAVAVEVMGSSARLLQLADYLLEMLDVLKIREREYRMVSRDLEWAGISTSKESKDSIKKYKEGLKRTLS